MRLALFIAFAACVQATSGANILGMFTSPGRSHLIIYMAVAKALVERGHNVTVVTTIPIPNADVNPQYRHILLPPADGSDEVLSQQISSFVRETSVRNFFKTMVLLSAAQRDALRHEKFRAFLDEGSSFDLMLLGYFGNDYQLGVAAHFKCPVAVISVAAPMGPINKYLGNPEEVAYVPNAFLGPSQPMPFGTRLKNFALAGAQSVAQLYLDYLMTSVYKEHFPGEKYPALATLQKNVSIVLCNHHFSDGPIRPNVPGMVEIGGIQIKEDSSPLPEDIAQFLNNSDEKGAIFFSLGSTAKSVDLNPETVQMIYQVLSRLDEKILWKWDGKTPPGNASNILFAKWLPQDDILAHKSTKLFITHGGKGSVTESEYHGVPMLVIPLFGDQPTNAKDIVHKGYGLSINHLTMTEELFENSIRNLLSNRAFTENVQTFSKLYRDRPLAAKQSAVYWVEYVIRHKGAPHIQSPLVHMNFFQSSGLDVILFVGLVGCILIILIKWILTVLLRVCKVTKTKTD